MNYRDLNDYELLSMISDNEDATNILFDKYKPLINKLAKKVYSENNIIGVDLNDVIQEGMIGLSIAINTFKEEKDTMFFTYARKCIESKMINYLVSLNRQKHQILNSSVFLENEMDDEEELNFSAVLGDNTANPESIVLDREDAMQLWEKLTREFTDFESQVFELKQSGFGYREIAEILDATPKKVDNALQRIKIKIRNILDN